MADDNNQAPFTDQQTEHLTKLVSGIVNSAISARDKMSDKKRAEDRDALLKAFEEKLSKLPLHGGGEGGEGGGEGGKSGGKKSLEIETLRKQLNDTQEAIRQANEKASKAEARRREVERVGFLDSRLSKAGIADPFMRELAIAHFDRKGRVGWSSDDEDASIVWNDDSGVAVDFEQGMSSWIKGEEAKRFLPPTGKGGSGSRPGSRPAESNQKRETTFEDVGNFVLGLTQDARIGE